MNRKPVKRKSKVLESNADMPKTPKAESKRYHFKSSTNCSSVTAETNNFKGFYEIG